MREGILQDNIYKRAVEKNISKKNKCDESIGNISISSSATYRDVDRMYLLLTQIAYKVLLIPILKKAHLMVSISVYLLLLRR